MSSGKRPQAKVLIIDDSDVARAAISETLVAAGYEVFELASAIGATRVVLRHGIAAVVVDLSMPGLSGDLLVQVLRRNAKLRSLVVVVVSGTDVSGLEALRVEGGADAVLSKAHIQTDLAMVIGRLLDARALALAPAAQTQKR
jgi:CheY-like chemotaxis protein